MAGSSLFAGVMAGTLAARWCGWVWPSLSPNFRRTMFRRNGRQKLAALAFGRVLSSFPKSSAQVILPAFSEAVKCWQSAGLGMKPMRQRPPAIREAVCHGPTAIAERRVRPVQRRSIAAIPGMALTWTAMAMALPANLITDVDKCFAQAEVQFLACDSLLRF